MQVVIFCGGKGTRLAEQTEFRPKPLIEVGEAPILVHIMEIYAKYGFKDFILCLGYKGDAIKQYFLNYQFTHDFTLNLGNKSTKIHNHSPIHDWNITFANTGLNNQTGSRLKQVEKYITDENFFVTYGDGVADINIQELLEFHLSHGKTATVTTVRPFTRFGNLQLDSGNLVRDFSKDKMIHEGWIDGGFFIFNKNVFKYLSEDPSSMLEKEPLQKLAKDGEFVAYKHRGFWQCMDTQRDYEYLNQLWNSGERPWKQ